MRCRPRARASRVDAAGLLYLDPIATDLHMSLNTSDAPLNSLGVKTLCPGSKVLEKVNASLR